MVEIVQLLVSPLHRYEGRPADGPTPAPGPELVERIELRAGLGIVGDRYFGKRAHRDASVTIMAAESLAELPDGTDLIHTRRNVLLRGFEIDATVGSTVVLDTGDGPVAFAVHRPANPCAWMDAVIGPGSRAALRRRGGVRCSPLTDGVLSVGAVRIG